MESTPLKDIAINCFNVLAQTESDDQRESS